MGKNQSNYFAHIPGKITWYGTRLSTVNHRRSSPIFFFGERAAVHRLAFSGNEGFTKTFVSATVRDLDKNFVALFEKEARNPNIIFWWILQKTVYCMTNKTLKSSFNCFDIVVKIRRNAFRSVEGTSNTIPFPFGRDFWFSMRW